MRTTHVVITMLQNTPPPSAQCS